MFTRILVAGGESKDRHAPDSMLARVLVIRRRMCISRDSVNDDPGGAVVVLAVLAAPHAGDALFYGSGGLLLKGLSVSCVVFKLLPAMHHGYSYARRE